MFIQDIISKKAQCFTLSSVNMKNIAEFMGFIEHIPGYFYLKDSESKYIACNANLAELAGLKHPNDIVGKFDKDLPWGSWQSEDFIEIDKKIMSTRTKHISINKLPIKRSDGNNLYIKTEKIPVLDENSNVQGILGIALDITDEKTIEQKLIKQKQENILANMPGYIYWKNKNSEYLGCNNNLARVSGLNNRSEIIGKTDFDFSWGEGQAKKFIEDDREVMNSEIALITENKMPIKRLDGNCYWVRTEKMPLYNNGQIVGVLAVAVDITEQKLLEEELKIEKEKAELSDRLKTEFVKNMEHDIRTPFSGILGMTKYLYEQENDETKKEWLSNIIACAKELLDYCNDILDLSKIESNELPIFERKFDLYEVFMDVIKIMTPPAKIRNLPIKHEFDVNLPKIIIGDRYRLYRILINLVSNAIKFTHDGEILVKFKLAKNDDRQIIIQVIVADTGIGIPEEKQVYIYEKFSKLNPSNQGIYKGIGIGLRIVKQFIHEMDGQIEIDNTVKKGSKFICTLPFNLPMV